MFADSRYADIEKKCRYADIADADINIGTPLKIFPPLLKLVYPLLIQFWQKELSHYHHTSLPSLVAVNLKMAEELALRVTN